MSQRQGSQSTRNYQGTAPGPVPRQQSGIPTLTEDESRLIIEQGDAELLVKKAREIGVQLRVTPTQLRRFFGEVKRIQMLWTHSNEEKRGLAQRRAVLLRPRLDYQVKRNPKVRELRDVLDHCIKYASKSRENFENFVDFYEALIAYAKE